MPIVKPFQIEVCRNLLLLNENNCHGQEVTLALPSVALYEYQQNDKAPMCQQNSLASCKFQALCHRWKLLLGYRKSDQASSAQDIIQLIVLHRDVSRSMEVTTDITIKILNRFNHHKNIVFKDKEVHFTKCSNKLIKQSNDFLRCQMSSTEFMDERGVTYCQIHFCNLHTNVSCWINEFSHFHDSYNVAVNHNKLKEGQLLDSAVKGPGFIFGLCDWHICFEAIIDSSGHLGGIRIYLVCKRSLYKVNIASVCLKIAYNINISGQFLEWWAKKDGEVTSYTDSRGRCQTHLLADIFGLKKAGNRFGVYLSIFMCSHVYPAYVKVQNHLNHVSHWTKYVMDMCGGQWSISSCFNDNYLVLTIQYFCQTSSKINQKSNKLSMRSVNFTLALRNRKDCFKMITIFKDPINLYCYEAQKNEIFEIHTWINADQLESECYIDNDNIIHVEIEINGIYFCNCLKLTTGLDCIQTLHINQIENELNKLQQEMQNLQMFISTNYRLHSNDSLAGYQNRWRNSVFQKNGKLDVPSCSTNLLNAKNGSLRSWNNTEDANRTQFLNLHSNELRSIDQLNHTRSTSISSLMEKLNVNRMSLNIGRFFKLYD
ncbi:hypothetical protein GJ496_006750 [Pomphorhynchus laevis]|nr:hypothetical protein GJ496_006750 [Pomphorhynchus laevis]